MEHDWKWNEESHQWELNTDPENNPSQNQTGWNTSPQCGNAQRYQGGDSQNDWQAGNGAGVWNEGQTQQDYQTQQSDTMQKDPFPSGKKENGKKGTGKKVMFTVCMAVVFGVIAGSVMVGMEQISRHVFKEKKQNIIIESTESEKESRPLRIPEEEEDSAPREIVDGTQDGVNTVADVAERCMPSVVSITNASVTTVQDFFGGIMEQPVETSGSGIIVGQNDEELLIATNNHVVEGGESITVAFCDDEVYEAVPKGNAASDDLAVISVKLSDLTEETASSIRVVAIGDSSGLRIGEQVVAIGNALGYGQSVTSGYVSALDRTVIDENGEESASLIQTDAAINHGNSGGPLLNMQGELIGINSSKMEGNMVEAMGYAIPVATAQPILDELMNRETRYKVDEESRAYVGVVCLDVEASAEAMYGIPQGAFVDSVEEDGPADQAGILKGDVIVKFDGLTVASGTDLVKKLEYYEAGEEVEIVISRAKDGEYIEQTVTAVLGKRSDMKQSARPRKR